MCYSIFLTPKAFDQITLGATLLLLQLLKPAAVYKFSSSLSDHPHNADFGINTPGGLISTMTWLTRAHSYRTKSLSALTLLIKRTF